MKALEGVYNDNWQEIFGGLEQVYFRNKRNMGSPAEMHWFKRILLFVPCDLILNIANKATIAKGFVVETIDVDVQDVG